MKSKPICTRWTCGKDPGAVTMTCVQCNGPVAPDPANNKAAIAALPDVQPVTRYGSEWWALYAAAWQARWPSARQGVHVHHKDGGTEVIPGNPVAVAVMAAQDADEGIAAFNTAICKESA